MYTEIVLVQVEMIVVKAGDTIPADMIETKYWRSVPVYKDIELTPSVHQLFQFDEVEILEDNIYFSFSSFGETASIDQDYFNAISNLESLIGYDEVYGYDLAEIEKIGLERLKVHNDIRTSKNQEPSSRVVFVTAWDFTYDYDDYDYDEVYSLLGYVNLKELSKMIKGAIND